MKKTYILIIIFLAIGSYMIISTYNINLDEEQDRKTFISKIGKWVFQLGKSTKNTATYAVKQDWLPNVNDTNNTEVTYILSDESKS